MKSRIKIIIVLILLVIIAIIGGIAVINNKKDAIINKETDQESELSYDEYSLVWQDEFEGDCLNRNDWNVELHDPGWVNEELQEYVDSEENIYIEDGKLILRPVKGIDENGETYYTSGRVNTQNKHDFTYGLFEARLKVPEGMGYLPAFWLMSTDENIYGQWPRCGEIDIMEVHGSDTATAYGTLHYGNPHAQSQGTMKLEEGTFSEDYHIFAVEWEPGMIKWFVDGKCIHSENDWYSVTEGQGEITFPAPFDQPFYMILNLAVGGSWVGYPDDTTDFNNAKFEVDYVRVYQKERYDEDVKKPVKVVNLREPDEDGEYIVNGAFSEKEDLTDEQNWTFLTTQGGNAAASINSNEIFVEVKHPGTVDYSVQLVQGNLPIKKGGTYEIKFDAQCTGEREILVGVSAPDLNYIRYMKDSKVQLTEQRQTYSYKFTMTGDDDANGRLEFNMGNGFSTEDITITNVSVKMIDYNEPEEDNTKNVLSDGNYLYNGKFQEGENRVGFWDVDNKSQIPINVTDFSDGRRLKINAEAMKTGEYVALSQGELALIEGNYLFNVDIEGETGKTIKVEIAGEAFDIVLEKGKTNYTKRLSLGKLTTDMSFSITFDEKGVYLVDNVSIVEDSLIKNGGFNAGLAGYEPYAYTPDNVSWVVDGLTEDNAIDFTINKTGDQAWYIQLKQSGIELEMGQWYRLTLDAKATIDRKIMFAIQRDGNKHNDDWTPYSGEKIIDLRNEYTTHSIEFLMNYETDKDCIFSVSMGAVGGTSISKQHRVIIDNILLEKINPPANADELLGIEE